MSSNRLTIMQKNKECYKCKKVYGLEFHHCFFGSKRKKSDEDGLTVWLCYEHHRGNMGVHSKKGHEFDLYLKQIAQLRWQEFYNKTEDQFRKRYGKSYL